MKISVVVPCFNEEECLTRTYERLAQACRDLQAKHGAAYEIIFVDDGSKDKTWSLIETLHTSDKNVHGIRLARNFGFQAALAAGLNRSTGTRVMVIDADLQDPPELLVPMWERMTETEASVVYGQRLTREGETWMKKITAAGFYRTLNWITDINIPIDTGDFRLMDRPVVDVINALPENDRFMRGLVTWVGFKQEAYQYHRDQRFAGVTKFNYRRMLLFAIDGITSFSIKPLRLAVFFGGILIVACMFAAAWALFQWGKGEVVPGWASVFIVQLMIGSLQLFMLGMIGEYVGRSFLQGKGRPLFIVAKELK